jgi:hypothetical protein
MACRRKIGFSIGSTSIWGSFVKLFSAAAAAAVGAITTIVICHLTAEIYYRKATEVARFN